MHDLATIWLDVEGHHKPPSLATQRNYHQATVLIEQRRGGYQENAIHVHTILSFPELVHGFMSWMTYGNY